MQTYIVRVYRTHIADEESVSGVIKDVESGSKESFHDLDELQTMLADSIGKGQHGFPNYVPQELDTHENIAVLG